MIMCHQVPKSALGTQEIRSSLPSRQTKVDFCQQDLAGQSRAIPAVLRCQFPTLHKPVIERAVVILLFTVTFASCNRSRRGYASADCVELVSEMLLDLTALEISRVQSVLYTGHVDH